MAPPRASVRRAGSPCRRDNPTLVVRLSTSPAVHPASPPRRLDHLDDLVVRVDPVEAREVALHRLQRLLLHHVEGSPVAARVREHEPARRRPARLPETPPELVHLPWKRPAHEVVAPHVSSVRSFDSMSFVRSATSVRRSPRERARARRTSSASWSGSVSPRAARPRSVRRTRFTRWSRGSGVRRTSPCSSRRVTSPVTLLTSHQSSAPMALIGFPSGLERRVRTPTWAPVSPLARKRASAPFFRTANAWKTNR